MRFEIDFKEAGISHLNALSVCYSSWVDPKDLTSNLIDVKNGLITVDVEPYAFLKFNKDDRLIFEIKDNTLFKIDPNIKRMGACTIIEYSIQHHYIVRMLGRILDIELSKIESLFSKIKSLYGHLVTTIGDAPFQVIVTDDFDVGSEMVEGVDYLKGRDGCLYNVAENKLYIQERFLSSVKHQDTFYQGCYPSYHHYIDYGFNK